MYWNNSAESNSGEEATAEDAEIKDAEYTEKKNKLWASSAPSFPRLPRLLFTRGGIPGRVWSLEVIILSVEERVS